MAELHDLSPTPGSRKNRKRVGRGPGSGRGKTSTRGEKGQKARSGGSIKPSFEGGQMPLVRRIPKRGFKSPNRVEYQVVNVRDLERLDGEVSPEVLAGAGMIRGTKKPVKVLGEGEIAKGLSVRAHAFSASARSKIEAAGGSVSLIGADGSAVETPANTAAGATAKTAAGAKKAGSSAKTAAGAKQAGSSGGAAAGAKKAGSSGRAAAAAAEPEPAEEAPPSEAEPADDASPSETESTEE